MTPTPKLRFVELDGPMMGFYKNIDGSETTMRQKIRVLQQWWEADITDIVAGKTQGEWRDVPLEKEQ
jgi:hypothetical protein